VGVAAVRGGVERHHRSFSGLFWYGEGLEVLQAADPLQRTAHLPRGRPPRCSPVPTASATSSENDMPGSGASGTARSSTNRSAGSGWCPRSPVRQVRVSSRSITRARPTPGDRNATSTRSGGTCPPAPEPRPHPPVPSALPPYAADRPATAALDPLSLPTARTRPAEHPRLLKYTERRGRPVGAPCRPAPHSDRLVQVRHLRDPSGLRREEPPVGAGGDRRERQRLHAVHVPDDRDPGAPHRARPTSGAARARDCGQGPQQGRPPPLRRRSSWCAGTPSVARRGC